MKMLNVAKAALYGIFLNYYCYYVLTGSFIPRGTVIFLAVSMMCVGFDMIRQRYVHIGTEAKCWMLYAVLSFATTALVLLDSGSTGYTGEVVKYVQRLALTLMIAYICEREKSIRFGMQLMAITAIALAVSVIMVLGDYRMKLNITSGANLSDNDTGSIMAYGCFAIVFAWGKRKQTSMLLPMLKTAGIICCLIVIFLTGSRKSILAVGIMLVLLVLLCFRDYGSRLNLRRVFTLVIIGLVAYVFITENLLQYAEETNLYTRLLGRGAETAEQSDATRMNYIVIALEDFAKHPFFGLGFAQFKTHHGNYSHCTYVEPLACSGIIGLLYLYPYYSMVKKQIYLIRRNKIGSAARLKQKEIFVYLCMALFVAVGIPYMYKDAPCILLGTFIASQAISFDELKKTGQTSSEY